MKIMEKKRYNKPEVKSTKIDVFINLQPASPNDIVGDPTDNGCPDGEICFINPIKWFK